MKINGVWILALVACSASFALLAAAQTPRSAAISTVRWQEILRQPPDWYGSDEAVRVADNVLAFQRDEGGWPKNIDMAKTFTAPELADIVKQKQSDDSTIDNNATWTQLTLLARVYTADRKSARLNSSHRSLSRMPSSA